MKVAKNPVASIILKWKKFGITKTLSRAGCPAKLRNWGRRALVREVTKNPMVTVTELQSSYGRTFQKDKNLCSNPANMIFKFLFLRNVQKNLRTCYCFVIIVYGVYIDEGQKQLNPFPNKNIA